jgi:hypothetical protein
MTSVETKRQTAEYNVTRERLLRTRPDLSEEEVDKLAIESVDRATFGFDAVRDPKTGEFRQQGIGSPQNPSMNSLMAVRKYEGVQAWEAAVRETWKRSPDWAAAHGLPKPRTT